MVVINQEAISACCELPWVFACMHTVTMGLKLHNQCTSPICHRDGCNYPRGTLCLLLAAMGLCLHAYSDNGALRCKRNAQAPSAIEMVCNDPKGTLCCCELPWVCACVHTVTMGLKLTPFVCSKLGLCLHFY